MFVFYDWPFDVSTHVYFAKNVAYFPFNSWLIFQRLCRIFMGMTIELTQEIVRRITTITEDTRETSFLFQRHSMALQRGIAVSFHSTMVTE